MKVNVELNEKNEVQSWAVVGTIENGKDYEVDEDLWFNCWYAFKLENGVLKYNEELHKKVDEVKNANTLIAQHKKFLNDTDYHAIKYSEGLISEEEYKTMKEKRMNARSEINRLERLIDEEL